MTNQTIRAEAGRLFTPLYRYTRVHFFSLFLVALAAVSCTKEDLLPPKQRGDLIDFTRGGSLTKSQIVDYATGFSVQDIVIHDVAYYYLTYRTEYEGKPINTKGLLLLPEGVDSICLLSYFHGTFIPLKLAGVDLQVPSEYGGGGAGKKDEFLEIRNIALPWASAGYAVFLPDYIGYGSTKDKEHPYVYYPELFKANVDGLLAVKQFTAGQGYPPDDRLFITGWSQGAGACLSAHKYIQENYADRFHILASSGLAGPYNFTAFLGDIFARKNEDISLINIYSWGVYTVNKFSGIKRPTDQLWSYPVFDQTSAFNPPSKKPANIFNNYFLSRIVDGTDAAMVAVIKDNSYHEGWLPVGKVFLHHGTADNVVPYFNSVDAYNGLSAAGGDITLYSYPGGGHDTELKNYVTKTLTDFNALK